MLPRPVHQGEEPAGCLSGGHNKAGCAVCSASSLTLADFHVEAARQQGRAGAVFNKKLVGALASVLVGLESFVYAYVVVVYERQRCWPPWAAWQPATVVGWVARLGGALLRHAVERRGGQAAAARRNAARDPPASPWPR